MDLMLLVLVAAISLAIGAVCSEPLKTAVQKLKDRAKGGGSGDDGGKP
jgi:hypothetical protein